jgi:endonuclease V-like protein UPF0215 family
MMKDGIRILAVDDSRFARGDSTVRIIGVVGRRDLVEGILSFMVKTDGNDATAKLIKAAGSSRFFEQIKLIAINGTTVAGMNIIDILKVNRDLGAPVLAITRKKPHPSLLCRTIARAKPYGYAGKVKTIKKISGNAQVFTEGGLYVQAAGIGKDGAARHVAGCASLLRLAHLIASGVSSGESRGRI